MPAQPHWLCSKEPKSHSLVAVLALLGHYFELFLMWQHTTFVPWQIYFLSFMFLHRNVTKILFGANQSWHVQN